MVATPEGRVNYNGSTFTNEYIISDQQGNARVSFNNAGTGGARLVTQENSYYGFGMVMPGSVVTGGDNKKLYNGQSEWQNDYSNMPDYYQTPGRNYDAEIGRFISADPMPESATDMSTYHYAGDNPIMMNDPTGNNAGTTGPLAKVYGDNPENNFWMEINNPEARLGETIAAGGGIMSQLQAEVDQQMGQLGGEAAIEEQYQEALAASTSVYHAGDGTEGDPSTGSLVDAVNDIITMTSSIVIVPNARKSWVFGGQEHVTFDIYNLKPSELQAIQVLSRQRDNVKQGNDSWEENGVVFDGFVDGGKNSPWVTRLGHDPADPKNPYYLTATETATQITNVASNESEILVYDGAGAVYVSTEERFEVILVAKNFNDSGLDLILGDYR